MAFADRFIPQFVGLHREFLQGVLLIVLAVGVTTALCAQASTSGTTTYGAASGSAGVPGQVQTSAQNPVFGSVPEAKATPGVIQLTFSDAIERALRQNLAGLLSQYNTIEARGEKWQQLSELLPHVNGDVQEVAEKESLEALGFRNGGPFGNVPPVIGPFSYFDVRASATLRVFDWKSIQKYRSSVIGESVAHYNLKDARDLVVLATGNAYLQAICGGSPRRDGPSASRNRAGAVQEIAGATAGGRGSEDRYASGSGRIPDTSTTTDRGYERFC